MKCLLLFLCLFGVVSADSSRAEWITNSMNNLTFVIKSLSQEAQNFQLKNLTYFTGILNKQVTKLERLRAEIGAFPLNSINVIHPSATESIRTEHENSEQRFKRLSNDYELVKKETLQILEKTKRESFKWVSLFIAASQNITYDSELPAAEQLIGEVKSIISKENAINDTSSTSGDKNNIVAEVDSWYKDTLQSRKSFIGIMQEKLDRFVKAGRDASPVFLSLKNENSSQAAEKVGELEKWLNKWISGFNMFKHFPIDNSKAADQVVADVGDFIRSAINLELLVARENKPVDNKS